jgi:hypothetical protein
MAMPIKFECTECHKIVTAPDAAGGKRGKCPFCGQLVNIPLPPPPPEPEAEDPDLIPLAPIDEDEERKLAQERKALYEQEQGLLDAMGPSADDAPLEKREDLSSEDLHHFVVNYLLDMFAGNLERAGMHADKLRSLGFAGIGAVDDFLEGKADEPALKNIPKPVREGFLRELKARVK